MTRTTKLALFLLILLLFLAPAACQRDTASDKNNSSGDLEALDPSGALVIFWHTLTGADEDRLLEMLDDFNAHNEWDITVVGEYQGDPQTLHAQLIAGLSSRKLPHLILTQRHLVAELVDREAIVSLSPYLEDRETGFTRSELADFSSSALSSERLPQFNDELFSFPACRSLQILYYNVNWAKELGYDTPPQTWETFREMVCAASQPSEGLYGYEIETDSLTFVNMLTSRGASLLNADATAYTFGNQEGQTTLQFLQGLIQDGCALWETEPGLPADFGAGRILLATGSTAEMETYRRAVAEGANFEWGFAPLPHSTEEPVIGVFGDSLAILQSTPSEELAAWLFVKWWAEPEQQARWARGAACYPTRRSALAAMEDYVAEHPRYQLTAQFLEWNWVVEPGVTGYGVCRVEIGRMLYSITAGEDVTSWLTDTRNRCNQALIRGTE